MLNFVPNRTTIFMNSSTSVMYDVFHSSWCILKNIFIFWDCVYRYKFLKITPHFCLTETVPFRKHEFEEQYIYSRNLKQKYHEIVKEKLFSNQHHFRNSFKHIQWCNLYRFYSLQAHYVIENWKSGKKVYSINYLSSRRTIFNFTSYMIM